MTAIRGTPRLAIAILGTLILTAALLAAGAFHAPKAGASATLGNISVTVTQMQCPRGGTVQQVNVHIASPGMAKYSSGNTVSGMLASYGNDEVDGSNFCKTAWWGAGYYWYWWTYRYVSFAGEHLYV